MSQTVPVELLGERRRDNLHPSDAQLRWPLAAPAGRSSPSPAVVGPASRPRLLPASPRRSLDRGAHPCIRSAPTGLTLPSASPARDNGRLATSRRDPRDGSSQIDASSASVQTEHEKKCPRRTV